jgi:hypothetical protein
MTGAGLGYPQSSTDEQGHEHFVFGMDPAWVLRPQIDRWSMLVSFLQVNPRLPRPR